MGESYELWCLYPTIYFTEKAEKFQSLYSEKKKKNKPLLIQYLGKGAGGFG